MSNTIQADTSLDGVRQRFEREAADFDSIYRLERSRFWRWFNTTFRRAVFERYEMTFAEAGDVTARSVLDIGCGSGIYAADFARRGATRVLGIDFSGAMLEIARGEAGRHGVAETCEFIQGNFLDVPLDETFDVSIAMGVYDYLPDPVTFMRKMKAVTRGKVLASFPGHSPIREPLRRLRYRALGKGDVYFYSEADLHRIAHDAGVTDYTISPIRSPRTGFFFVGRV